MIRFDLGDLRAGVEVEKKLCLYQGTNLYWACIEVGSIYVKFIRLFSPIWFDIQFSSGKPVTHIIEYLVGTSLKCFVQLT